MQRRQQSQPPTKAKPKAKASASTIKAKKTRIASLPATVEVCGYEITIPSTKTCWRVCIYHSCGHPIIEVSEVRYPGCDRPMVVEINRHMRPCTDKCKTERLDHMVNGLCQACQQQKQQEEKLGGPVGVQHGGGFWGCSYGEDVA
ncbi:unnamed protein product [Discula destructiva]